MSTSASCTYDCSPLCVYRKTHFHVFSSSPSRSANCFCVQVEAPTTAPPVPRMYRSANPSKSGTQPTLSEQNCSLWGFQSLPALSRTPAGTLTISSLRGVVAEILLPQTRQKARVKGFPDSVSRSTYLVMSEAPVWRVYC